MLKKSVTALFGCLLFSGALLAQQNFNITRFANKEGFNQNTVTSIEQDKFGFLWIGTPNGLIKYDGYDFLNLTTAPEFLPYLPQSSISKIFSDNRGLLWILSGETIHAIDVVRDRFYEVQSSLTLPLFAIAESENGTIWVAGEDQLFSILPVHQKDSIIFKVSPNIISASLGKIVIRDMVITNDEMILIGSDQGLFGVFMKDKDFIIRKVDIKDSASITCILKDENIIWIGTNRGLVKAILDNSNEVHVLKIFKQNLQDLNSLPDNLINSLCAGENGNIFIGTATGGVSIYNDRTGIFSNQLVNNAKRKETIYPRIKCLYFDNFEILWIGTSQGGLFKLDLNQKPFINLRNNIYDNSSISGDLIYAIYEDSRGYLWISSAREPLCRSKIPIYNCDPASLEFERFDRWYESYPDKELLSIYEDKQGYIWLGYWNSLVVHDPARKTFRKVTITFNDREVKLNRIRRILPYGEDKLLLAGTSLVMIKDPWKKIISDPDKIEAASVFDFSIPVNSLDYVASASVDSEQKLWLGTFSDGLLKMEYRDNAFHLLDNYQYSRNKGEGLNHNTVFGLYHDLNKNLWIGTFGGGLNKMSFSGDQVNPGIECIGIREGLANNAVYGILPENDSILWISTDMGLSRYNSKSREFTSFNIHDGLSSNNYRLNAYFKGNSGYLYFGGLNGLTLFRPEDIKSNDIPPQVKILGIEINNHRLTAGDNFLRYSKIDAHVSGINELRLSHKENSVAFDMLLQHYASPENNKLSFFLDGFDKQWILSTNGKHKYVYTNLPPGNYTFRVKGYTGDGVPSGNEINIPVNILSPWYKRWWSYSLYVLMVFSAGFGISWYYYKIKRLQHSLYYEQKDKQRIEEINQAKLKFFTSISHEFRTPLSLISTTSQLFERKNLDSQQKKDMSSIDKNTKRLLNLIDQLLTFRKSEKGFLKLKYGRCSLGDFIYPIIEAFENYSSKKEINFIFSVKNPDDTILIDYEKMERVVFNILSNAFKYSPVNGTVKLDAFLEMNNKAEYVRINITDNGKGIPKSELNNIFERFYQLNQDKGSAGTGIGLSLSKSIVDLHNGFIEVESDPGVFTMFSIMVPKNPDLSPEEKLAEVQETRIKDYFENEDYDQENPFEPGNIIEPSFSLMIVEDEKEFRDILIRVLGNKYKLLEAEDGNIAFEILHSNKPDLIISDIMMPALSGYELCKAVKSDIRFCHIPVILLTAMGEEEMQIQGVEFGADSYITKPFNVRYLLATIRKLLENREKLKEHFSRSYIIPDDLKLSSIDRSFIESLNNLIESNLDNSEFGVERLAKEMHLSTVHLYRKLKQLTGQAPNVYIRNYRLQRAADIIENNPEMNIKEVMYSIGFESASYFSASFKEKFGMLPSEFPKNTSSK